MSDAASEQQPLPPAQLLRLLAHGLSDAQIAELLVISPRTVNTHLRSISSKLGLTSRHAVTRYASITTSSSSLMLAPLLIHSTPSMEA